MKLMFSVLLAGALTAGACNKKEPHGSGAPTSSATEPAATPTAKPFDGKLTSAIILGAGKVVQPFDPWDEGLARLKAQLGPPTRIYGDKHSWAVIEGDDCTTFTVALDDGGGGQRNAPMVGMVARPDKSNKVAGPTGNYQDCLEAAGVAVGPADAK